MPGMTSYSNVDRAARRGSPPGWRACCRTAPGSPQTRNAPLSSSASSSRDQPLVDVGARRCASRRRRRRSAGGGRGPAPGRGPRRPGTAGAAVRVDHVLPRAASGRPSPRPCRGGRTRPCGAMRLDRLQGELVGVARADADDEKPLHPYECARASAIRYPSHTPEEDRGSGRAGGRRRAPLRRPLQAVTSESVQGGRGDPGDERAGRRVITVVGIGADGWDGLPAESRRALETAEVLMGGIRQLGLMPASTAERGRLAGAAAPGAARAGGGVRRSRCVRAGQRRSDVLRRVASLEEAAARLADMPVERVFLTTGRRSLPVFTGLSGGWLLARSVDPPTRPSPPTCRCCSTAARTRSRESGPSSWSIGWTCWSPRTAAVR